jgi:manganese transport protein
MKKILGITLGIMTALGGFVDLSQIVFTMQAGSLFGYRLMWVVLAGCIAIVLYMEMCGRVAAVAQEPVFAVVRTRLGNRWGVVTLIGSNLLNLITCAAEIGGLGILLHVAMGWSERLSMGLVVIVIGIVIGISRLQWIERVFGLTGLLMVVFGVAVWYLHPDWNELLSGFLPRGRGTASYPLSLYAYFAVGIFSAMLMEYEVHFYSSGAIEEEWTEDSLGENVAVATLGSTFGAVLTCALVALGAIVFLPRGIFPENLSTTAMPVNLLFSPAVLNIAFGGMLACIGGAAIETALSGAYNICQFYNRPWGKNRKFKEVPLFTGLWIAMLLAAAIVAFSGIKPMSLVNISVIFGMVVMPLTYYPILSSAGDRQLLGRHANGPIYRVIAWVVLVIIIVCAVAAIPLTVMTNFGQP